jgi:hypothetical protein
MVTSYHKEKTMEAGPVILSAAKDLSSAACNPSLHSEPALNAVKG